jgi:hypothetical protein
MGRPLLRDDNGPVMVSFATWRDRFDSDPLVPEVRAAIQNGRQLQELINEAGVRYLLNPA